MNKALMFLFVCAANFGFSQIPTTGDFMHNQGALSKGKLVSISVKKTGPYFGLQQGEYLIPEFGVERQWKKIKFKNAVTHGAHMGFNYNFKFKVLGYDGGYWIKPHRVGLTYGANVFFRTDFTRGKVGVAPVIGFKFWLLHFQTGYHFMANPQEYETNTFFVSLRLVLTNERDVDFNRKKKG
jgi:hypothetical protein